MAETTFPEKRFKDAKIKRVEIDVLRRNFNNSDLVVQRSLLDFWAGISTGGIREYVERQRESGIFNAVSESKESLPSDTGEALTEPVDDPDGADGEGDGESDETHDDSDDQDDNDLT